MLLEAWVVVETAGLALIEFARKPRLVPLDTVGVDANPPTMDGVGIFDIGFEKGETLLELELEPMLLALLQA